MNTTTTAARNPGTRRVLAAMAAQRCAADAAEANLLALAVDLVALHPITDELPAASGDRRLLCADPDTGEILEDDPRLGGEGTPAVAERAVCDLGAALDVSYAAALALVSDAVELCFRLPRLWALVQSGRLQTWKAR